MTINPNHTTALVNAGVPEQLAVQVAEVISRDDPSKPDLGRSEADQAIVNQAWQASQK
ncbi:hypothetical protein VB713_12420 [Anabaena cylindrica UHCC 0172]|uniref:hypothetical protein n=1 Tax=Anabaena cylindrica TaxID=1165 RepID=UPI002B2154D4|nr:hypothetical protein [Anabaena cylindrica]MEA5551777.1 hypothetical protein [Anabaena cylindrica UHCC 0172]